MEKELKKKKEKIEFFTDEMARDIYPFQPPMVTKKGGGKPITNPLVFKATRKK